VHGTPAKRWSLADKAKVWTSRSSAKRSDGSH
jgi:hypothetical protein